MKGPCFVVNFTLQSKNHFVTKTPIHGFALSINTDTLQEEDLRILTAVWAIFKCHLDLSQQNHIIATSYLFPLVFALLATRVIQSTCSGEKYLRNCRTCPAKLFRGFHLLSGTLSRISLCWVSNYVYNRPSFALIMVSSSYSLGLSTSQYSPRAQLTYSKCLRVSLCPGSSSLACDISMPLTKRHL